MSLQQTIQLLQSFPPHLQTEVAHFVEFLAQKQVGEAPDASDSEGERSLAERRKANRGRLKGKIHVHPGFDDPIEGFEAYMP